MDDTRDFEAELTAMKTRFDERQRSDNPLGWENTAAVFSSILIVQRQYIDVLRARLAAVEVERDTLLTHALDLCGTLETKLPYESYTEAMRWVSGYHVSRMLDDARNKRTDEGE